VGTLDEPVPEAPRLRESRVAQMMTSSRIGNHPTALFTTGLPILQIALNTEIMTQNLRPLLDAANGAAHPHEVTHANLVAYKQGNRGLIRYDVAAGHNGPQAVLGKLYPDPGRAQLVGETMRHLWADVFGTTDRLTVPQPLGCVPELAMLVFKPLPGALLNEALVAGAPAPLMELCARWLAALHDSTMALKRRLDLEVEVVNLEAWTALIEQSCPGHAARATELCRRLLTRAAEATLQSDAPIHKDFHYQHVFVNGGLGVIDFDEMRWGDRNFDVGHFCAHLFLLCGRAPAIGTYEALEDEFLAAYAGSTQWSRDERFDLFFAYTCLKIAKQLATTRGVRPRPEGSELHRQLALVLDGGLAAIGSSTS
jgi:Phosphotransferase enzyme family